MGSQLEDQAAEARDEAADRTKALDQRGSELSGRIEELETELRQSKGEAQEMARIAERRQLPAANSNRQIEALMVRAEDAEAKKLTWMRLHDEVEVERDALRVRLAEENADVTKEVCRAERAEREVKRLHEAIATAKERTQNMVLYCGSTLDRLRAPDTEIERETHGTDTGM